MAPSKKQKLEKEAHEEEELTVSPIYAKPTVDFTFKKLFGNDHNKPLTIDFLNSIFDFTGDESIRNISFENTFHKRSEEVKMSIFRCFLYRWKRKKIYY